jgi:hypothetical protein
MRRTSVKSRFAWEFSFALITGRGEIGAGSE